MAKKLKKDTKEILQVEVYPIDPIRPADPIRPDIEREIKTYKPRIILVIIILLSILAYFLCTPPIVNHCF